MELDASIGLGQENEETLLSGLKIWAKVGAELGETVKKQAETNEKLWRRLQYGSPVSYRTVASGTFVSGQKLVLNLGAPDAGTYWNVRSFAIGGTDVNVSATGGFGLYISGFTQSNYSPGMGALVDGGGTYGGADVMPYSENYGSDSLRVQDSEQLFAVIQGGTNGQTYIANATMLVYNVAAGLGKDVNVT
jgi:hypothetical protein